MLDFIQFLKVKKDYAPIFSEIKKIVSEHTQYPEGNCFWEHATFNENPELFLKQYNLYNLGKNAENILEIGFNAGHSAAFFLMANEHSKLLCFDICHHSYTLPCFRYLSKVFPGRLIMIQGSSLETVPQFVAENKGDEKTSSKGTSFDLLHIDGCHLKNFASQDILNCRKLADTKKNVVILDDCHIPDLKNLYDELIEKGTIEMYKDPKLVQTVMYPHLIVKFLY